MRKLTVIFSTLVLLTLSACGNGSFYGKWHSAGNTVIFDRKGTFEMHFWDGDSVHGSFVITDSQDDSAYSVVLCDENGRKQEIEIVTDGNSMTLPNGIYKKQ